MDTKESQIKETKPRVLEGIVVSDKMDKTIVVEVLRLVKHPQYGKYIKRAKRHKAHDETNAYAIGDKVRIVEVKPISKDKTFKVVS